MLKVEVIDSGIGISKDDHSKLFKMFGFINDRKQKNTRGIGLGLMISQRLVHEFNGTIEVESTPNKGSVFKFTIQLSSDEDIKSNE